MTSVFAWTPSPRAAYVDDNAPPPDSATDIKSSMSHAFAHARRRESRLSRAQHLLEGLPPFWRDTYLTLKPRLYNFDRNRNERPDQETFAAGTAIEYRSGEWLDRFSIGMTGFTAQKLHGPMDAGGVGLLRPAQNGFGVLGEAYAQIKLQPFATARLYRQELNLPYFNRQDSRMVPTTHEAYLLGQPQKLRLQWAVGHITKIKQRDSARFVPLTEAAGYSGTDDGATLAGFRWRMDDDTDIAGITFQVWDFMNISYAEGRHSFRLHEEIPVSWFAQATYEGSTGSEIGGEFDTFSVGSQVALSYRSFVATIAATVTGEDAGIRSPFGGSPSYLSMMLVDFDRAGELAWLAGLSYDFRRLNIDGLSINLKYAQGYGDGGDPDRDEVDVTIDWKPLRAFFQGMWIRLRYANLDQNGGTAIRDLRFIVNYEIPLL